MLINSQNNNQSALQGLKSSFIRISKTGASGQASVVKKVALAVINLLLIPFRLAQKAYYKLFKVKAEPKTGLFNDFFNIRASIEKINQSTILKTALAGIGVASLISFGYKPSTQSSQIGLSVGVLGAIFSLPVFYGLNSILSRKKGSEGSFKELPTDVINNINCFLGDEGGVLRITNSTLNKRLSKESYIKRENALAKKGLNKIEKSEVCREYFAGILGSNLSSFGKLAEIKDRLKNDPAKELLVFEQDDFADQLVTKLKQQFPEDLTLSNLEKSINSIKVKIGKGNPGRPFQVNKAIIDYLDSNPSLKNHVESLDLSDTKLRKGLPNISNMEVLKLDLRFLTTDSIISYVEIFGMSRLIAEDQIKFADKLVAELSKEFPEDDATLIAIKDSIASIKESNFSVVEKAEQIDRAIMECLDSEDEDGGEETLKNSVTKLNLGPSFRNQKLRAILPCIGNFPNLEDLNLGGNELYALPDSIGGLTNLKNLNLFGNRLTVLPDSIGGLENLENFNLSRNQLTVLPDSIGGLKNLKSLRLFRNQLTVLPDSIGNLKNLEDLNLFGNRLTKLNLGYLEKLEKLDLSHNQLTEIDLYDLYNLEILKLNNNKLVEFYPRRLSKLKELDLSNNKLTLLVKLASNVNLYPKLKKLNLSNNELTALHEFISRLVTLNELDLSNNKLTGLPTMYLNSLRKLDLSNNKITKITESIKYYLKRPSYGLNIENNPCTVSPVKRIFRGFLGRFKILR